MISCKGLKRTYCVEESLEVADRWAILELARGMTWRDGGSMRVWMRSIIGSFGDFEKVSKENMCEACGGNYRDQMIC